MYIIFVYYNKYKILEEKKNHTIIIKIILYPATVPGRLCIVVPMKKFKFYPENFRRCYSDLLIVVANLFDVY